jgi:hypothetical protein
MLDSGISLAVDVCRPEAWSDDSWLSESLAEVIRMTLLLVYGWWWRWLRTLCYGSAQHLQTFLSRQHNVTFESFVDLEAHRRDTWMWPKERAWEISSQRVQRQVWGMLETNISRTVPPSSDIPNALVTEDIYFGWASSHLSFPGSTASLQICFEVII